MVIILNINNYSINKINKNIIKKIDKKILIIYLK